MFLVIGCRLSESRMTRILRGSRDSEIAPIMAISRQPSAVSRNRGRSGKSAEIRREKETPYQGKRPSKNTPSKNTPPIGVADDNKFYGKVKKSRESEFPPTGELNASVRED